MGLELAVTQQTGYDAVYWKLHDINVSRSDAKITLTFFGYKDKAASDEGWKCNGRREMTVPFVEPFKVTANLVEDMYVAAKKADVWAEAKDVLEK